MSRRGMHSYPPRNPNRGFPYRPAIFPGPAPPPPPRRLPPPFLLPPHPPMGRNRPFRMMPSPPHPGDWPSWFGPPGRPHMPPHFGPRPGPGSRMMMEDAYYGHSSSYRSWRGPPEDYYDGYGPRRGRRNQVSRNQLRTGRMDFRRKGGKPKQGKPGQEIPQKWKKRQPMNKEPWMTKEILNEIQKKHALHQKAQKLRTMEAWNVFKRHRNKVANLLKEAKMKYNMANPQVNDGKKEKPFCCDTCEKAYADKADLDKHIAGHVKCDDCDALGFKYEAHPRVTEFHKKMLHEAGLVERVMHCTTEEDIANWKQERKSNYPTAELIAQRKEEKASQKTDKNEVQATESQEVNEDASDHPDQVKSVANDEDMSEHVEKAGADAESATNTPPADTSESMVTEVCEAV